MKLLIPLLLTLTLAGIASLSHAWSRPGHMVTGAIAHEDSDLAPGTTEQDAKILASAYVSAARATGETRIVLAGYRLSDLLRTIFR